MNGKLQATDRPQQPHCATTVLCFHLVLKCLGAKLENVNTLFQSTYRAPSFPQNPLAWWTVILDEANYSGAEM